jgi:hypothetical protein
MHVLWAERDLGRGEHLHDEIVDPAGSEADRLAKLGLRPLFGASDGGSRFRHPLKLNHDFMVGTCAS